jgi:hypothetical protein
MDHMLNDILINLADSYPQAPAAGGTARMKEIITEVDRVDDEENDFIFTSGIKIADYLNKEGDYTRFIMTVINAAIQVTQDNQQDSR